ncbi:AsmA family protein [Flavobacterium sp. TMP13]|uniref:AsmA family protein n=1 Tax=Flavobacterium sp. TMP13 TaxID=3425950 RepID=UPI003D76DB62
MGVFAEKWKSLFQSEIVKKWARRVFYFIISVVLIIVVAGVGLAYYFNTNKTQITTAINSTINENIAGKTQIGDFEYQFLKGFPNVTLILKNVTIEDSLFKQHKHQLLNAAEIEVRLHIFKLLRNEVDFQKIAIKEAAVYIYKDSSGYSNTSVFRNSNQSKNADPSTTGFQIKELAMEQVRFVVDNQLGNKIFDFDVATLKAKPDFEDKNWTSEVILNTKVHQLTFNKSRGSFAKDQIVAGIFKINYTDAIKHITIQTNDLHIGKEVFDITSFFNFTDKDNTYQIDIRTKIMWSDASKLLSQNITKKLDRFDLKKPLDVRCTIDGDLTVKEDPLIVVTADVKDDEVKIPDAILTNCTFMATFTNHINENKGFVNANSAILFSDFNASYHNMPFRVTNGKIINLDQPIATGKLNSDFKLEKLNDPENEKWLRFSGGNAKVALDFKFDILDFYITKPLFTGNISVANASFQYFPKDIKVEKTNLQFRFLPDALVIDEFTFKEHTTIVQMKGRVDNFLNLYYDAPEKMIVNWSIYSPRLDIKQFLSLLSKPNKAVVSKKKNVSSDFQKAIYKSTAVLDIKADKMVYGKLSATQAQMKIKVDNAKLSINKGFFRMAGGTVQFNGQLSNPAKKYTFAGDVVIEKVEIATFLRAFDNFGITSFDPTNIKGNLYSRAKIAGRLNANGTLMKKESKGAVSFKVKDGALVNFRPFVNIGQIAFPFRDVKNVAFSNLSADLDLLGEDVLINKFAATSNVINFDMSGIYSFGKNTNLNLTIPLRNPKNDLEELTVEEQKLIRERGIVLNLSAVDEAGKIKIKWGNKAKD